MSYARAGGRKRPWWGGEDGDRVFADGFSRAVDQAVKRSMWITCEADGGVLESMRSESRGSWMLLRQPRGVVRGGSGVVIGIYYVSRTEF